jgi:hypothetical protein
MSKAVLEGITAQFVKGRLRRKFFRKPPQAQRSDAPIFYSTVSVIAPV